MTHIAFGLFDWIDRGTAPLQQLYVRSGGRIRAGVHPGAVQSSVRCWSTNRSAGQRAASWAIAACGVSPWVKKP